MIKMVIEVWRKPGLSYREFSDRWYVEHGALVRQHAAAMGFVRYIQSHRVPSEAIEIYGRERGWKPAPDGLAELWWESEAAMEAALGSDAGRAANAILSADEAQFVEMSKISAYLAEEKVVFDFA